MHQRYGKSIKSSDFFIYNDLRRYLGIGAGTYLTLHQSM